MSEDTQPDRSTIRAIEARLLGGPPTLTVDELAATVGITPELVRAYWRSLGFADVPDGVPAFTRLDVEALRQMADRVLTGGVSLPAAQELVRAQGHTMDRLVLWQFEALVDDASTRFGLDDTSARLVVLDRLSDLAPALADQLVYVWRRQLAALLGRMDREVSQQGARDERPDELPLERAIGMIDIVAYTTRSAHLRPAELARLVRDFESAARDVIARHGARVVKTVGDAVLFVADDLVTGALVATALPDAIGAHGLPVRGAVVWGRVLSRSGDVFGPIVNLVSRLTDVADQGDILVDDVTAAVLEASAHAGRFALEHLPAVEVQGLGEVAPVRVRRAGGDEHEEERPGRTWH